eukprot:scaffold38118_cov32-Tisochrysis_lutea.AAC.2
MELDQVSWSAQGAHSLVVHREEGLDHRVSESASEPLLVQRHLHAHIISVDADLDLGGGWLAEGEVNTRRGWRHKCRGGRAEFAQRECAAINRGSDECIDAQLTLLLSSPRVIPLDKRKDDCAVKRTAKPFGV